MTGKGLLGDKKSTKKRPYQSFYFSSILNIIHYL
jgi:hypothetical protein